MKYGKNVRKMVILNCKCLLYDGNNLGRNEKICVCVWGGVRE